MTDDRSRPRSILLVAQLAPPSTLVAARRTAGLTKYLARLGYRVTVLTSQASGEGEIEGAAEVVRTPDLIASPLNWRRRHFEALAGDANAGYARPSRLQSVVVPDLALVTWLPFALPRALALAAHETFDAVVTTSPPQSAHLIGVALKRRGIGWIAELRDGWTFEPPHEPWPSPIQRSVDAALERFVLKRADAVVGVTAPIVDDLRSRLGISAVLITNGFDPDEVPVEGDDALLDPGRHSLVHTGRMAIARSTPQPLLAALRKLRSEDPRLVERLEVVFAGPLSEEEKRLVSAPDLAGTVRPLGPLDRPRALRLQRAADTLLVVTEGSSRRSVATGKLFEYLASGRPILVLGEETEAARIAADTGAGFATSATDPEAIADALRTLVDAPSANGSSAEAIEPYSYPRLARTLAAVVERVSGG